MKCYWTSLTTVDRASVDAYVSLPDVGPAPGVVVLQEIFGVNAFVRHVVERLAGAGYAAIAPDLFGRQQRRADLDSSVEADRARAMQLMAGIDAEQALADARAARDLLRSEPATCSGQVGAVGYCLGGRLAYLLAARGEVDAAVGYYGVGIEKALGEMSARSTPLWLHVAGEDHLCPPDAQRLIEQGLAPYADRVTVDVHAGVGHGFARSGSPALVPDVARRADAQTMQFLVRHLRGAE